MGGSTYLHEVKPLALALGGGGALGAAHVGVLQVLHERGITPTIMVGTSAGSIAAGATALGIDPYDLERRISTASWTTFGAVSARPGLGLLSPAPLHERVRAIAGGDPDIEDLPLKFAAVSTDLATSEPVVLDSGKLADAVAASIAVPGIFRPVTLDGRHLIDGGVVQNLPIETAIDMGAAHVIAVRLAPEWDGIGRSKTAMHVHEFEIRADVTLITPRVRTRSQLDTRDLPSLVQLGREAAEAEFADYPVVNERPLPPAPEPAALEPAALDSVPATLPAREGARRPALLHRAAAHLRRH